MSEAPLAAESGTRPLIERISGAIAFFGGLLSLAVAMLVVVSVAGRWLSGTSVAQTFRWLGPIPGDFELVQMATAVSVFAFLPYCQARRGNIFVDTFTTKLPARVNALIDAVWDLVYAGVMALLSTALINGALDHFRSQQTTMLLQLLVWPALAACAALTMALVAVALVTAATRIRRHT